MDNNGYVLAPLPVAPVNEADTVLLPEAMNTLKRLARLIDLKIDGSYLNLDGGFDSRHSRKATFNAGLIPNINENPRNRKTLKRGRKRLFNPAIHLLRICVERTFAWEDKSERLLLRFEFKQQRPYGMKLMAYTMINLRHFAEPETRNQLTVCQALAGNYREEHVFALTQAVELYDVHQTKVAACDKQIEVILKRLRQTATPSATKLPPTR